MVGSQKVHIKIVYLNDFNFLFFFFFHWNKLYIYTKCDNRQFDYFDMLNKNRNMQCLNMLTIWGGISLSVNNSILRNAQMNSYVFSSNFTKKCSVNSWPKKKVRIRTILRMWMAYVESDFSLINNMMVCFCFGYERLIWFSSSTYNVFFFNNSQKTNLCNEVSMNIRRIQ